MERCNQWGRYGKKMLSSCCFAMAAIAFRIFISRAVSSTSICRSSAKPFSALLMTSAVLSFCSELRIFVFAVCFIRIGLNVSCLRIPFNAFVGHKSCLIRLGLAFSIEKDFVHPRLLVILLKFSKWGCFKNFGILKEALVDFSIQFGNPFAADLRWSMFLNLFAFLDFSTILVLSDFRMWFLLTQRRFVSGEWPRFLYIKSMSMPLILSTLLFEDCKIYSKRLNSYCLTTMKFEQVVVLILFTYLFMAF